MKLNNIINSEVQTKTIQIPSSRMYGINGWQEVC